MQQLENELTQTQTNLETSTHNLEEKEKALQNVSQSSFGWFLCDLFEKKFFLDLLDCTYIILDMMQMIHSVEI